jgi:5-formyltetrahydrofolate cyclo-ligase
MPYTKQELRKSLQQARLAMAPETRRQAATDIA